MKRKAPIKVDESEPRDPIRMDEFTDVVRGILKAGPPDVKSENREPTKEELEQRFKVRFRRR